MHFYLKVVRVASMMFVVSHFFGCLFAWVCVCVSLSARLPPQVYLPFSVFVFVSLSVSRCLFVLCIVRYMYMSRSAQVNVNRSMASKKVAEK